MVDTRVWGLSQTRIAPLAFMFLFIIITAAYTWNGGNEKQATRQNKWTPVSFTASVNGVGVEGGGFCFLTVGYWLFFLAGLNLFFVAF